MKLSVLSLLLVSSMISLVSYADEVLVYRHESMPWCGTVEGRDAGVTVEILTEITLHGGPTFTYQSVPWLRAQKMVHKVKGSAIIPLTRTQAREAHYTWIVPLVPNQIRLSFYSQSKEYTDLVTSLSLEQASELPIGVIQGSSIIPTLKEIGFSHIYEADNAVQMIDLLVKNRFDAMVESKLVDSYQWRALGLPRETLIPGPNVDGVNYIYLGAGLDFPQETAEKIRAAMERIKANGVYDEILARWY